VSVPHDPAITIGYGSTDSFVAECWVYYYGAPASTVIMDKSGVNTVTFQNWSLGVDSASKFQIVWGATGSPGSQIGYISGTTVARAGQWYHLAYVKTGSDWALFVDGVRETNFSGLNTANDGTTNPLRIGSDTFVGKGINGIVSDVRIYKGSTAGAPYAATSTTITIPTSKLTAIAGTQLLTCQYGGGATNNGFVDQSSFNNIITRVGNASQGTFSPFSPNGWSTYFDGTGDYLQVASNTAFNQNGAFTVEGWVYPIAVSSGGGYIFAQLLSGYLGLLFTSAGKFSVDKSYVGTQITSTSTYSFNKWYHVAMSCDGTTTRLFVDGTLQGSATTAGAASGAVSTIGFYNNNYLTGYVSNLRFVKGTALYTTAFTPSVTPLTAVPGTSLLTCQDNRFIDSSPNNFAITRNGDAAISAYSPFGSMVTVPKSYGTYFDGTGDSLTVASNSAFQFGTGDFTIETWIWPNDLGSNNTNNFINIGTYLTGLMMRTTSAGGIQLYLLGTSKVPVQAGLTAKAWNHVALVRIGTTCTLYINGTSNYSFTDSSNLSPTTATVTVGMAAHNSSEFFTGYISNMRIVKGAGVYTSAFAPPTEPLTTVSNTSLLICQSPTMADNSVNAFPITVAGDARSMAVNPFGTTTTMGQEYSPDIHGSSIYLDGTGDYLTAPGTKSFDLSTGPWTLECWFYQTASKSNVQLISIGPDRWRMSTFADGSAQFLFDGTSTMSIPAGSFPFRQWNHFAVSFSADGTNSACRTFANGKHVGSGQYVPGASNSTFYVGRNTDASGGWDYNGYITDIRILKGVSLYSSGFAVPVAPAQVTGKTTFLLNGGHGGIADAHAITNFETVGNVQVTPEDPYRGSYYSNYFDGTGDSLTLAANTAFDFGSNDFTIECHFMLMADAAQDGDTNRSATLFSCFEASGSLLNSYSLALNGNTSTTGSSFGFGGRYGGTLQTVYSSTAVTKGVWHHIAVTKTGNTASLYYDGNRIAQNTSYTNQVNSGGNIPRIGTLGPFGSNAYASFFPGYISNLRIVNGSQVYTGTTYTVPIAPLTAVSGTSLLTCQSNSFKDNSTNNFAITQLADTSVKSRNPYQNNTGSSMYFDGTGDWVAFTAAQYYLGRGDFTIEGWINVPNIDTTYRTVFSLGNPVQIYTRNGTIECYLNDSDDTTTYIVNGVYGPANSVVRNAWTHIALVRNGTLVTVYVNGVAGVAATNITASVAASAASGYIGAVLGTYPLTGYVKDLRVTRGLARYTTGFTPPTTPFIAK